MIKNTVKIVKTNSYQKALENEMVYNEDKKEKFTSDHTVFAFL